MPVRPTPASASDAIRVRQGRPTRTRGTCARDPSLLGDIAATPAYPHARIIFLLLFHVSSLLLLLLLSAPRHPSLDTVRVRGFGKSSSCIRGASRTILRDDSAANAIRSDGGRDGGRKSDPSRG